MVSRLGAEMEGSGKCKRQLQGMGGSEVELLPGSLFPHEQERLVRLSSWMPFGKVAQLLEDLRGVYRSKVTGRRHTQAAEAAYVALQTEVADQIVAQAPPAKVGTEKALLRGTGRSSRWCGRGMDGGKDPGSRGSRQLSASVVKGFFPHLCESDIDVVQDADEYLYSLPIIAEC